MIQLASYTHVNFTFLSSWQKEVESAVWDISQQITAWN